MIVYRVQGVIYYDDFSSGGEYIKDSVLYLYKEKAREAAKRLAEQYKEDKEYKYDSDYEPDEDDWELEEADYCWGPDEYTIAEDSSMRYWGFSIKVTEEEVIE